MVNKKIVVLNPFRVMGYEGEDIIKEGGMGAVTAPAGVGKTALMVQLALNAMLRDKKVLHISLNDPVHKVNLWYQELFHNLARQSGLENIAETWESLLPNRFIMTFKVEGFNVPKLKERMTDLIVQKIFLPEIVIIDGLKFDEAAPETLTSLKAMAGKHGLRLWFTVHASFFKDAAVHDIPDCLLPLMDFFDVVFKLQPEGGEISVTPLSGKPARVHPLFLDPATLLIKNQAAG